MRSLVKLALVFAVAAGLCGCPKATGLAVDSTRVTPPDVLTKAGLKYYWVGRVPLEVGETVREIYRLDENVYCMTNLNRLIAVDAITGISKWSYPLADPKETVFAPVHADSVMITETLSGVSERLDLSKVPGLAPMKAVMANTLSYLVVLDRSNGRAYRKPHEMAFHGFVANDGGATDGLSFFVGSPDGQYEAVTLQDGLIVWTRTTTSHKEPISAPIAYYGSKVYVANEAGGLFCTSAGRLGQEQWSAQFDGAVTGAMYVDSRGCFVPCWDHRIYALQPISGEKLWEPFICDGALQEGIQVGEKSIFQYAHRDKFYVVDVATGRLRWTLAQARQILAASGGDVYLRDDRNNLIIADEMLGTRKASLPLVGQTLFVSNPTVAAIYAGNPDGRLFCITPTDVEHLTVEMLTKGKPVTVRPVTMPASAPAKPAASAPAP